MPRTQQLAVLHRTTLHHKSYLVNKHIRSVLSRSQPRPYTFKEHVDTYDQHISRPGSVPPPVPPKDDRKCGLKKRTFWMLMGCVIFWLIALAVGLGAGLGIGLSKKNK
jgi:hypothetical protein